MYCRPRHIRSLWSCKSHPAPLPPVFLARNRPSNICTTQRWITKAVRKDGGPKINHERRKDAVPEPGQLNGRNGANSGRNDEPPSSHGRVDRPSPSLQESASASDLRIFLKGADYDPLTLTPAQQYILHQAILYARSCYSPKQWRVNIRVLLLKDRVLDLCDLLYPFVPRTSNWLYHYPRLFRMRHPDPLIRQTAQQQFHLITHADNWRQELGLGGPIAEIREKWQSFSREKKGITWTWIMLKCLSTSVGESLAFLQASFIKPFPPFELVMDSLLYIKRMGKEQLRADPDLNNMYLEVLSTQRQPWRWFGHIQRRHLDLFLEDSNPQQGRDLFDTLRENHVLLGDSALHAFLEFFTQKRNVDSALEALSAIDPRTLQDPPEFLLKSCSNLLKLDHIEEGGEGINFYVARRMLEAGLTPRIVSHNMMMKNAIEMGAPNVAWDLFNHLVGQGVTVTARTLLLLAKDALRRDYTEGLEIILDAISSQKEFYKNPWLIAYALNITRVVYGQRWKLSPPIILEKMLSIYCGVFKPEPLRHLGIIEPGADLPPGSDQSQPDINTIAHVVCQYVMTQRNPIPVNRLWDRVDFLVSQNDEMACGLVKCLPFYDSLIFFYGHESHSLSSCLRVLRLMLDQQVQPSERTLSLTEMALENHGQTQAMGMLTTATQGPSVSPMEQISRITAVIQDLAPQNVTETPRPHSNYQSAPVEPVRRMRPSRMQTPREADVPEAPPDIALSKPFRSPLSITSNQPPASPDPIMLKPTAEMKEPRETIDPDPDHLPDHSQPPVWRYENTSEARSKSISKFYASLAAGGNGLDTPSPKQSIANEQRQRPKTRIWKPKLHDPATTDQPHPRPKPIRPVETSCTPNQAPHLPRWNESQAFWKPRDSLFRRVGFDSLAKGRGSTDKKAAGRVRHDEEVAVPWTWAGVVDGRRGWGPGRR